MTSPLVGTDVRRREDGPLIRGAGRYVDDIKLPRELCAAFARSPHANARVLAVDTSAARATPGVVAAWTAADVSALGTVPVQAPMGELRPLLAAGAVRHAGEAVAMVVAHDRYAAADGAAAVRVAYEPLPAVTDVERAAAGDVLVHDHRDSNVVHTVEAGDAAAVAAAIASAGDDAVVVTQRMVNGRVVPTAIEPRGVLVDWPPGDPAAERVTIWSSTQVPWGLAGAVAAAFDLPISRVRAIAPQVGGAFGSKLNVYAEELLVCFAARATGRPVRWTETRREAMAATTHGRGWVATATLATDREGRILAYALTGLADLGAYLQSSSAIIPALGLFAAAGPYRIPAFHYRIDCVHTHAPSTDSYRGAGRPEAVYFLERSIDLVARELGVEPAAVRLANFWAPRDFPVTTPSGMAMDSGDYPRALTTLLDAADLPALREWQRGERAQGRVVGIGYAAFVEPGGIGPSYLAADGLSFAGYGLPAALNEGAVVRVNPDASVTVTTGSTSAGQGHGTAWSQLVADALGLGLDRVSVLSGDSSTLGMGIGSFASRSAAVGGTAVVQAATVVRDKAVAIAAALLEADPADVVLAGGVATAEGDPARQVSWAAIAETAYTPARLPEGLAPGLEADAWFDPPALVWAYGAHLAVVDVDPATGVVEVRRYLSVDDAGNLINPAIVEGQVHGGVVQGLGQALTEEVVFHPDGRLRTDSLEHYHLPVAANVPVLEGQMTTTPTGVNPLGVKGVGEGGAIAAPAAIANAVSDALAPLGAGHVDMPFRSPRVWAAIQAARPAPGR